MYPYINPKIEGLVYTEVIELIWETIASIQGLINTTNLKRKAIAWGYSVRTTFEKGKACWKPQSECKLQIVKTIRVGD